MAEEEDVDLEALQAQIDLSMSVANDLATSWIKPANKPKPSYNQNLEAELKEYMRKPPRLGVGASIPETSSSGSSRETARLKGHLGRGRGFLHKQASDDEGESRAGAIRKKPIPNPFVMPAPKKKKVDDEITLSLQKPGESPTSMSPDEVGHQKKKKKKRAKTEENALLLLDQTPNTEIVSQSKLVPETGETPGTPQHEKLSPHVTPDQSHRHRLPSDPLPSVLNLNGPVGEDKSDSDDAHTSPSRHKKKRKRRKKKKNHAGLAEFPKS
ncbi:hypothetical protein BDP27DRAFT_1357650 [Rhodocollybia butyracea]|uniref:Uncharacterized protein n=1 Tax=Rhodocollybia butyracea TaxID=206335 RepID=A0A9P5Q1Z3_9AGAR|nr:hypothetical protein BDP27DRAFT_1357650 [Rhodocollybia butyracea]